MEQDSMPLAGFLPFAPNAYEAALVNRKLGR
jgi:hypothetical protein